MAEYKDYYKILGVNKNATDAEIKKAFKVAARKYHPDLHPESEKAAMTEKFKDVNEAYAVLSDKQKRAIYDQVGQEGYQNYARGGGASAGGRDRRSLPPAPLPAAPGESPPHKCQRKNIERSCHAPLVRTPSKIAPRLRTASSGWSPPCRQRPPGP